MTDNRYDDLRAEIWRVMALGQRLHPADFEKDSKCEGWSVSDVFAHLAGSFSRYRAWLQGALEGDFEPPFARSELAADNDMLLLEYTALTGRERLEAFEDEANSYLAELELVDTELPQGNPLGTMTVGEQVVWATVECAVHGWDIAAALGIDWPAPASVERMRETWLARRDEPLDDDVEPWLAILAASGREP